jgi:hypothetical protein
MFSRVGWKAAAPTASAETCGHSCTNCDGLSRLWSSTTGFGSADADTRNCPAGETATHVGVDGCACSGRRRHDSWSEYVWTAVCSDVVKKSRCRASV